MNLAEQLWLCGVPGDGVPVSNKLGTGVGGAIAAELVLAGKVRIEENAIFLLDSKPTGDPLLDEVLPGLEDRRAQQTKAISFVGHLGRLTPKVIARLEGSGAVVRHKGDKRRFWVDKPDWFELTDAGEQPRRRLRSLLLGEQAPDGRDAVLVGLVDACDLIKLHVSAEKRKLAEARAKEIAEHAAFDDHVRDAIKAAQNATASAVLAAQSSITS